jgi:anti-sigma-K factor RskA
MTAAEHDRHRDDAGPYLLGALPEDEARAFEAHLRTCHVCRDELGRLRVAADVLPRSVPQFEPPPSLKAALMETVEAEARAARGAPAREPRWRGWLGGVTRMRPRVALTVAVAVVALAVVAGFGVAQLVSDDHGGRELAATVDHSRLPGGRATLTVDGDGHSGGILQVRRFPQLQRGRTYQAWVDRGGKISPQPTFDVRADGSGVVALPTDLRDVDAVLVTRERRGGSPAPSEQPVMRVNL